MSQATLRVVHAGSDYAAPYPGLPDTPGDEDAHSELAAVRIAMQATNAVALAEHQLDGARRDRAFIASNLHFEFAWSFRRIARLLRVTEGAVRFMVAKHLNDPWGGAK